MCTDVVVQCSIGKVGQRRVGFSLGGVAESRGPYSLCAPDHGITCSEDSGDTQVYGQCQWCFTAQCNTLPAWALLGVYKCFCVIVQT